MALLALSLVLLVVSGKIGAFAGALSLVAAFVAGAIFIRYEARASDPILDPALFREPTFAAGAGIMALQNFAMYGLLFQLPQFFVQFRDSAARDVGYMLFAMMIGMVAASPIGGRLADRIGSRRAGLFGAAVLVGCVLLGRLESFASPHDALVPLLIFGVGMGLCSAPAQTSCMSTIDPRRAGMAAGASSTARYLGGIVSILVLGSVLGSGTTASIGSHKAMMWLFAAAVLGSCLAALGLHGGPRPPLVGRA